MELDENVQPASSRRSYTLSKDVLPPLETLVVTIVGSTELDGILYVALMQFPPPLYYSINGIITFTVS